MSKRILYRCDICRDDVPKIECFGLNFSTLKKFHLADPDSTDGVHICWGCIQQLEEQIPKSIASITRYSDPREK